MKLLCISAGHGGTDPGAMYKGYFEKELTLPLAKRVGELLKEFNPVVVRKTDSTLNPNERAGIIKDNYAFCLDIHFNAGGGSGIETIHSIYSKNGKRLAEIIANQLKSNINLPLRRVFSRQGISGDYYYMHRQTGSTCTVIVECLFLDSDKDLLQLNLESMAHAIANGFKVFYAEYKGGNIVKPAPVISAPYYTSSKEGITHFTVLKDPMKLKYSIQNECYKPVADKKIVLSKDFNLKNCITGGYQSNQGNGFPYPVSIIVSEGKVICKDHRRINHQQNIPVGTFIVYKNGKVTVKPVLDITEEKDIWFAMGGCSILPDIRMKQEGFTGVYANGIGYSTLCPSMGYRSKTNEVVLAIRPDSNITRRRETLINLGCDIGITLDGGASSVYCVDGKQHYNTGRTLYGVITW